MKPLGVHNYFVYITTNKNKSVLYKGVTNNLNKRLDEHKKHAAQPKLNFTGRYKAFYLVYWERFQEIDHAIQREKQIKGWTRSKKKALIKDFNPEWRFLNEEIKN